MAGASLKITKYLYSENLSQKLILSSRLGERCMDTLKTLLARFGRLAPPVQLVIILCSAALLILVVLQPTAGVAIISFLVALKGLASSGAKPGI